MADCSRTACRKALEGNSYGSSLVALLYRIKLFRCKSISFEERVPALFQSIAAISERIKILKPFYKIVSNRLCIACSSREYRFPFLPSN